MAKNQNIFALTGDLGYGGFQPIIDDYPERFVNCGAAEQCMLDMAVGLALEDKIPFVYSISPFLIFRAFETIRNYLDHERIPVKLIGSGASENCYETEGFSHYSADIPRFTNHFKNIKQYIPPDKSDVPAFVQKTIDNNAPTIMLLRQK